MHFAGAMNSQFQYLYFIAGDCATADEAYRVLSEQLETREAALAAGRAVQLRLRAQRLRLEERCAKGFATEADRLEAEADKMDLDHSEAAHAKGCEATTLECSFLKAIIAEIDPLRKYKNLSAADAAQACQREEWLGRLKTRAENHLATSGTLPADQLAAMRLHPDFDKKIAPHLEAIERLKREGKLLISPPPAFLQLLVASSDLPALEDSSSQMRQLKSKAEAPAPGEKE